ncbi:MAG: hypothetical protein K2H68_02905 [Bacteroidales bacterium]|nr:hypothetical protein [Bacteroidales bacterium]
MFDKKMTLEKFFYENKNGFDTHVWLHKIFNKFFKEQNEAVATYNSLIRLYMDFKKGFQEDQKAKIAIYHPRICKETGANIGDGIGEWWVYRGCVLGTYCKGNKRGPRIGIECVFKDETSYNPLGDFHIYVATWGGFDIKPYEKRLKEAFPNRPIDDKSVKNRAFLLVKQHNPDELNKIINTLSDTYNTLKGIIEKHK